LIASGRATGQEEVLHRGLKSLRWLTEQQTTEKGHLRPIGSNGFYPRGGARANFDQQPIEAQATVAACLEAYRATADVQWYELARCAFDWFLGGNDLGLELYVPETGGCHDGLHADRVNGNQGAESTLAFLLSLVDMRQVQDMLESLKHSITVEEYPSVRISIHSKCSGSIPLKYSETAHFCGFPVEKLHKAPPGSGYRIRRQETRPNGKCDCTGERDHTGSSS
jgi:hypothetical protein